MTLKNNRAPLLSNIKHFCIISSSYVNSNWSYSQETVKLGYDLCDLDLWPMTLTFCMDITSVIGNNSWKFRDDTMKRVWQTDGRTDRQTDRRKDWTIHRAAWSQLKTQNTIRIFLWANSHSKMRGNFGRKVNKISSWQAWYAPSIYKKKHNHIHSIIIMSPYAALLDTLVDGLMFALLNAVFLHSSHKHL